jgi:hypothetical protein
MLLLKVVPKYHFVMAHPCAYSIVCMLLRVEYSIVSIAIIELYYIDFLFFDIKLKKLHLKLAS